MSKFSFCFSLGEANVLAEFVITEGKKKVPVAGCRCVKGTLKKDAYYRVIRGQDMIHEGEFTVDMLFCLSVSLFLFHHTFNVLLDYFLSLQRVYG